MEDELRLFHPIIQQWFRERFGSATEIQFAAWPAIAAGQHVLITAPTGSGKTLAAFLWAINTFLVAEESHRESRVLYISPLKALNNDIQRNLEQPLSELKTYFDRAGSPFPLIQVSVRSGDTDPTERRQMIRRPPEILITTPESLNVLLTSKSGRRALLGIKTLILDEIHSVTQNKRGTYLMSAVERLVPMCGEFQRIALSATVRPLDVVAEFVGAWKMKRLGGNYVYEKRPVTVLESRASKHYDLHVIYPEGAGQAKDPRTWWPAVVGELCKVIERNRSTLLFTNSRRMTEKVTRLINESGTAERIYSHHGSLSKEIRTVVEKRFKEGELSAVVATSSLELGIDIGSVDEVVLIQAPHSIASAIQRVGRAGHGVGQRSRGTFCLIHSRDLLEAAVLAAHMDAHEIEPLSPLETPLDVLAQVVLSMVVDEEQRIDEVFAEIKTTWAYHGLSRKEFDLVLEMLAGRYADTRIRELKPRLIVDRIKGTIKARENVARLLFLSGGVIPDRGYYNLRLADSKAKIGELDEEFVWERSVGDVFPLGNQLWSIQRITHNDIEVLPATKTNVVIPFWRAEELDRPFHFSERIALFLEEAEKELGTEAFRKKLLTAHHTSEHAADCLIEYLKRQREATHAALPHRHHLLVEHFFDPADASGAKQTVLHTLWGGQVNRPLALALSSAWEATYHYPLQTFANNDCILLNLPHAFSFQELLALVPEARLADLLRARIESTTFFGARFRQNAQRALLLPRRNFRERMPLWLNRLRSKRLLDAVSRFEDFPILLETWRGCMNHDFDMDSLAQLLAEVRNTAIKVTEVVTHRPSPFAEAIIWSQTNKVMYEDDAPGSTLKTNLSADLLKQVLRSGQVRPRLSDELIRRFEEKAQRVADGYAPANPEELLEWIKERRYISLTEWDVLLTAIGRDHAISAEGILAPIADKICRISLANGEQGIIALEDQGRTRRALGITREEIPSEGGTAYEEESAFEADPDEILASFLSEWLRFYGPVSYRFLLDRLGVDEERLGSILSTLAEHETIMVDVFRVETSEKIPVEEVCDTENLEILLRLRRAEARPVFTSLDLDSLPLFFAAHQGLVVPGSSTEDLKRTLEQLFGYPARAQLWETEIFPARLNPYYPSWLDGLMNQGELVWFGCGKERVSFCFESDCELFADEAGEDRSREEACDASLGEVVREAERIFSSTMGRLGLGEIASASTLESLKIEQLVEALWYLAWQGRVTNDSFEAVRKGIRARFRPEQVAEVLMRGTRSRLNRWKDPRPFTGNWYLIKVPPSESLDAIDRGEITKDRIRLLLARYGILFRELVWNELPMFRWPSIFRILRLMELSGEVLSGHFFKGIPGPQFCSHEAFRMLTEPPPEDAVYWMNATDPVSLCGIDIQELRALLPSRLPTTHVVFHGKRLVIVSKKNGEEVEIRVPPDHPGLQEFLAFFKVLVAREFGPVRHVRVATVNGESALQSPYARAFLEFGFQRDFKSLTLRRRY